MNDLIRIGVDTSKSVFQLHGVNAAEQPVLRKKLRRRQFLEFFQKLPATRIGIEACGAAHHWGRELSALGHEVVLLPPQRVKPYVDRNKNDAADADAICEAMSRPRMTFVAVKTAEQQAALMLVGVRNQLVGRRTQLSNAIRGYAAEFGLVAAKGNDKIEPLLVRIASDENLTALAKSLFVTLGDDYVRLKLELRKIEAKLMAWHRGNELSRRLAEIPSVGPIGATLSVMKIGNPHAFRSGRDFSAWLGAEGSLHRRQDAARRDHAGRRRGVAQCAGRRGNLGDPAGSQRPRTSLAMADCARQAQAAQARRRGARQQDGADHLEADGQWRTLQPAEHATTLRSANGQFSAGRAPSRPSRLRR